MQVKTIACLALLWEAVLNEDKTRLMLDNLASKRYTAWVVETRERKEDSPQEDLRSECDVTPEVSLGERVDAGRIDQSRRKKYRFIAGESIREEHFKPGKSAKELIAALPEDNPIVGRLAAVASCEFHSGYKTLSKDDQTVVLLALKRLRGELLRGDDGEAGTSRS